MMIGVVTNSNFLFCIISFNILFHYTLTNVESLIELSVNSTTSDPKFDRRRQWKLQLTEGLGPQRTFTDWNICECKSATCNLIFATIL